MERIIKTTDEKYIGFEFNGEKTFNDGFYFKADKIVEISITETIYSNSNYIIITNK